jgi:hypothetical protein
MPFAVPISIALARAGWKVKIFDAEGPERPHVTIRFKTVQTWRVAIRDSEFGQFLSPGGRWSDIPPDIKAAIETNRIPLQQYWDAANPHNPTTGDDDA